MAPTTPAAAQSVWELTPYRIQLLVAFTASPELTPRLKDDVLQQLTDRIDVLVGAPFDVTVASATGTLAHTMTSAMHTVTGDLLPKESLDFDKVMLLAVVFDENAGGCRVAARDYDVRTRLFSAAVSRPVRQLGKLRDVAFSAMLEAFAPLGRIERVEKKLRIRVLLATAPDAKLTQQVQQDLLAHFAEQAKPLVEEKKREVTAAIAPVKLRDALGSSSEAVSAEAFSEQSLDALFQQYDELIALYVYPAEGTYRAITVRLSPLAKGLTASDPVPVPDPLQEEQLREVTWNALFKAIDGIRRTRKTWVTLRLKAGALPFRDRELALVKRGTLFCPVIRFNDREGNLRKDKQGNAILPERRPWTFCIATFDTAREFRAGQLICRVHSGLRSPLSGRLRGRVQQFALAVVPPRKPSVLAVVEAKSDPPRPLAGYGIYAHPPNSKQGVLLGHTDRRGRLTIRPVESGNPLRMLLVRNGGELLAHLAVVPGMQPELVAKIPNDDRRLQAEGFVTGLQEQMVDVATRRAVLFARTRTRIRAGKFKEAQQLIDQARGLPTASELVVKLDAQQKKVRAGDPKVQAKIKALFSDTRQLLRQQLDENAVEALRRELREASSDAGS